MANIAQDPRYAVRMLWPIRALPQSPYWGADTVIFSTVNAVLLRPLPYRQLTAGVNINKQVRGKKWFGRLRARCETQ
jgi:hypothetical protein